MENRPVSLDLGSPADDVDLCHRAYPPGGLSEAFLVQRDMPGREVA